MPYFMEWHETYLKHNRHRSVDAKRIVNGVEFFLVGHNASHEFYLGLDGSSGKVLRLSCFEEDDRIDEFDNPSGYIGHW